MKNRSIFPVLVILFAAVRCDDLDFTQHQDEHQMHHFQDSLFNIFERLGKTLNRNQTVTEDRSGNLYVLNIVKNLSLNVPSSSNNSAADNSELWTRLAKLESQMAELNSNHAGKHPHSEINSCGVFNSSGVYNLHGPNKDVYCEMEAFDGGWIVIQQREGFKLNFARSWADYRNGFGTPGKEGEFWLGNEAVHRITSSGEYELVVELKSANGTYGFARYTFFELAGEADKYRISIGRYSGTVEDKLRHHNGSKFTTYDSDNESWEKGNCATYWSSGWWYNDCYSHSTLNYNGGGPFWGTFANYGTYSRMMIRRK